MQGENDKVRGVRVGGLVEETHDSGSQPEKKPSLAQTRLVDILNYIEKVEKLNQDPFFSVHQHKSGFVEFQDKIRGLPNLHFNVSTEADDDVWLKVERILPESCPVGAAEIRDWIVKFEEPSKEPTLKESNVVKIPFKNSKRFREEAASLSADTKSSGPKPDELVEELVTLQERPELASLFAEYLSGPWKSWSLRETPRRKTIELYGKLFELHRTIELESSVRPLEVVWGVGLAVSSASPRNILYPILSQLVEVTFDNGDNSILVRPRDASAQLEVSSFYALDNPGTSLLVERAKVWLKDTGQKFSPFVRETFDEILRAAVSHLDKSGRYWPDHRSSDDDKGLPEASQNLIVTDSWVLFARPRTSNFLLQDLTQLKEAVLESDTIGGGPSAIVSDPTDEVPEFLSNSFRGLCGLGSSSGSSSASSDSKPPSELFFPKPYNREQLSIVDLLEQGDGVVVQGPPGTGKTHTIANIICHYLASGKRVLVTSKGEPALAVIRDQIPEGIRSLVVSILTNEREGLKQVQNSIEEIGTQVSSMSSQALKFQINELKSKLDSLHEKITSWDREINSIAKQHLSPVPFGDTKALPGELAEELMKQFSSYSWFPDELGVGENFTPRFKQSDLNSLAAARKAIGNRLCYLNCDLPSADSLCDSERLLEIHANLIDLSAVTEKTRDPRLPRLRNPNLETLHKAEELLQLVRKARKQILEMRQSNSQWAESLHERFRHKRSDPTVQQIIQLASEVEESEKVRISLIADIIDLPPNAELFEGLRAAVAKCGKGEKPFAFFDFSNKDVKALHKAIRLNGVPPHSVDGWRKVHSFIDYLCRLRELTNRWNGLASGFGAPEVPFDRGATPRQIMAIRQLVTLAKDLSIELEDKLKSLCDEVFSRPPVEGFFCELTSLDEIERLLSLYLPQHKLKAFEGFTGDLLQKIANRKGEAVDRIKSLITTRLGKSDQDSDQLKADWVACLDELAKIEGLRSDFSTIKKIAQDIAENGAPIWAEKLRTEAAQESDVWVPTDALRAWDWKLRHAYLSQIDQREKLKILTTSKVKAEAELARTYQEYVRSLTWLKLKGSLSNKCRSALQAYLSALKNIGKGKGKTVRGDRFRDDARKAMTDAYAAVPCWIMPHWRVSEALPAEIGLFDLVILDEASQSDIWALPALVRGKKILVVGDDEQISPTTFAREEDILRLRDQFLSGLPHNFQAQVLPGKSIYDLARVVFPQSHITLVEHFRCVAPIVEFSNQLCYNGRIQCLRVPKASERIDPPLVDVFVKGGYRDGKKNLPEARAIVNEITKLVNDPRYAGRSIGVVSLLGNEQAHLLNDLILEKLGEEVIQHFNILCGDSMTFQGNERDIMFLSMVATADEAVAQTKREFRQRFNVAASRARDRMYLFRSVKREDLSNDDLRARLIEHFDAPMGALPEESLALRDTCQSSFELAIFDALIAKGFKVVPQVESSGFYIDMVVEGENDRRLAIECDGDQFHGPEKWADDFGRQRVLERAGWTFWRCWGSSFYLDSAGCLEDLFRELESMGIEPIGKIDYVPVGLVEHREVDPNSLEEESTTDTSASADQKIRSSEIEHFHSTTVSTQTSLDEDVRVAVDSSKPQLQDRNLVGRVDGQVDVGEEVEYCFIESPQQSHRLRVIEIGPTDLAKGLVNVSDPLGAILVGLREGDEVGISSDAGTKLIRILKIYDLPSADSPVEDVVGDKLVASKVDGVVTPDFFSETEQIRFNSQSASVSSGGKLNPMVGWTSRPLSDPRSSRSRDVLDGILDIVKAEGPVVCERVYRLYCEAAGLGRMGSEIRNALDKAVISGMNKGVLVSTNEYRTKNRLRNILRAAGKEDLLHRECGDRSFEEIPPSELAAAMRSVHAATPALSVEELYRRTLKLFGLSRVSEGYRSVLSLAYRDYFSKSQQPEPSVETAISPT